MWEQSKKGSIKDKSKRQSYFMLKISAILSSGCTVVLHWKYKHVLTAIEYMRLQNKWTFFP